VFHLTDKSKRNIELIQDISMNEFHLLQEIANNPNRNEDYTACEIGTGHVRVNPHIVSLVNKGYLEGK
jgi:hypothetical protein